MLERCGSASQLAEQGNYRLTLRNYLCCCRPWLAFPCVFCRWFNMCALDPLAVREADLLPSVALLFRWTGQSAVEMAQAPALRPELLRAAKPATVAY